MDTSEGHDIALIGMPRGGTTLACALINASQNAVALSEPMDVTLLDANDRHMAVARIQAYFNNARRSLLHDGTAISRQRNGQVPDNTFSGSRGQRSDADVVVGVIRIEPPPPPHFTLAIKHNAAFAALLPELRSALDVIALVRHPLAVLASWHSIKTLNVSRGRLPAAERLDVALHRQLETTADLVERQLHILHWFFERFTRNVPDASILRYEAIVASEGALLRARANVHADRTLALRDRNNNPDYAGVDVALLAGRLCARRGAWEAFYPPASIAELAARMQLPGDA